MGLYNTKEKDRRAKINRAADMVMSSPTYKKWERTYKNK
jgi:hypothetical protein